PPGAVVEPVAVDDLAALDAEEAGDVTERRVVERSGAHERRTHEREPAVRAADRHEPRTALLDGDVAGLRGAAGLQPGVAAAERRVTGERELVRRREDPQPVVGTGIPRRQHERRLREVRPPGEPL